MHKKRIYFSLLFIFSSALVISQVKNYTGAIVDIFDNPLYGVQITNERSQETIISNCEGRFSIRSNRGDLLTFSKENYLYHQKQIKSGKKMMILLNFDTQLIMQKIDERDVTLHDFETPIDEVLCQPLFLVDGEPSNRYSPLIPLEEGDVYNIRVIKGRIVYDMFGDYSRNGVIFIQTTCKYQQRVRSFAVMAE